MQQLQYETSWDKALSAQDRQAIEEIFNETKQQNTHDILLTPIREALNHKQELLVTVLVHNFTKYPLTFHKTRLVYRIQEGIIADKEFTLPMLTIPPQMSMPWTFIFAKNDYTERDSLWNGQLEIY